MIAQMTCYDNFQDGSGGLKPLIRLSYFFRFFSFVMKFFDVTRQDGFSGIKGDIL